MVGSDDLAWNRGIFVRLINSAKSVIAICHNQLSALAVSHQQQRRESYALSDFASILLNMRIAYAQQRQLWGAKDVFGFEPDQRRSPQLMDQLCSLFGWVKQIEIRSGRRIEAMPWLQVCINERRLQSCSSNVSRRRFGWPLIDWPMPKPLSSRYKRTLTQSSGLNAPQGLALSGGNLFVTDINNGTIGEYNATNGATVSASLVSGLNHPESIAVVSTSVPDASSTWTLMLLGLTATFGLKPLLRRPAWREHSSEQVEKR
jgi:hypothetical protein